MNKILVINGPNLNLLGKREVEIYGKTSLKDIESETKEYAKNNDLEVEFKQSNEESEMINWIQSCMKNNYNGLLINAGAYTHTSIAIFDALKAIKIPIVEIHLSNIHKREEFRKKSYISEVADGVIFGFGSYSYILAVMAIKNLLKKND
tara:strand:- start:2895 stop:3341 length:447 start_codon:yes stop_codon:yes gene_type:complete